MSTSGDPARKAKASSPFAGPEMTPEERKAAYEFARDPARVQRSARAYFKLLGEGALDDVR